MTPSEPHAHYALGVFLGRVAKHEEALSALSRALQFDSTNAEYWSASGVASGRLGHHAQASQYLHRAMRLAPNGPATRLLAEVHEKLGFPDSAVALFRTIMGASPLDLTLYGGLAAAYIKQEKFDSASAAFREQSARTPHPPYRLIPNTQAALVHVLAGRHDYAMAQLEQAVAELRQVEARPGGGVVQYREIAVIEAALGDRDRVKSWTSRSDGLWRELAQGVDIVAPVNRAPHVRSLAISMVLAGFPDDAHRLAAEFQGIVSAIGSTLLPQQHELAAMIAISQGDLAGGGAELQKAGDQAYLGRAVYAEALKRAGRLQEAQSIKAYLLNLPVPESLTAYYVVALAKARSL
jgi:tetratricopeptide (TPR) repeat protein